jgi:hypothetical protein
MVHSRDVQVLRYAAIADVTANKSNQPPLHGKTMDHGPWTIEASPAACKWR